MAIKECDASFICDFLIKAQFTYLGTNIVIDQNEVPVKIYFPH